MSLRSLSTVIFIFATSFSLNGQQLAFSKDGLSYHYQWLQKSDKQKHLLSFSLTKKSFKLSKFLNYLPKNAQRYVERKLKRHTKTYDPKSVQFKFTRSNGHLSMEMKSSDYELLEKVQRDFAKLQVESELEYLKLNHYQYFSNSYGERGVKPDHLRIIKESQSSLVPVSNALTVMAKGKRQRYLLELILSFIQSIPYDQLKSRDGLRGAGFVPPVSLISENKGDCDSKATLMLTLLKNIYPNTAMALIFVPEHAFIALNVGAKKTDRTIVLGGVVFVVADPTGPSQIDFGQVSKKSAHYLDSGLMQYELLNKR